MTDYVVTDQFDDDVGLSAADLLRGVVFASAPGLFWAAVVCAPAWVRVTTLSAALMLWLGLIVFGLVCSFFDARESIAQGAREIEL